MSLVKVNFPAQVEKMFSDVFNRTPVGSVLGSDFYHHIPSVNVLEEADKFVLEMAAPGLDKKDFQIHLEKDKLTISAKKMTEKKAEKSESKQYKRREFNYESFERSFYLSEKIDTTTIAANYENGVLLVSLPKKVDEKPATKNIAVL
jgi:HSP20 family protein